MLPSVGLWLPLTLAGGDDSDAVPWFGEIRESACSVSRCRKSEKEGRSVAGRIAEKSRAGPASCDFPIDGFGNASGGGVSDRFGERLSDERLDKLGVERPCHGLVDRLGCDGLLDGLVERFGVERFSQGLVDRLGSERLVVEWSDRVLRP
jgi:hypothetical protein